MLSDNYLSLLESRKRFLLNRKEKYYQYDSLLSKYNEEISDESYALMLSNRMVNTYYLSKEIQKGSRLNVSAIIAEKREHWEFLCENNIIIKVPVKDNAIKHLLSSDRDKYLSEGIFVTVKDPLNNIGSLEDYYKYRIKLEFLNEIENPTTVYDAMILEKNKGGYICQVKGLICFLPGSLAGPNKLTDFYKLVGKTVKVMIETYLDKEDMFVVSNKKYINFVWNERIKELSFDKLYKGNITGYISNAIFIEWDNFYTGMLKIEDMSDELLYNFLYKRKIIQPTLEVEFYIKNIDDNGKIFLTQTRIYIDEEDWINIKKLENTTIDVVIFSKVKNGYYCLIDYNSKKFIGYLKYREDIEYSIGDKLPVFVKNVDVINKKILLE